MDDNRVEFEMTEELCKELQTILRVGEEINIELCIRKSPTGERVELADPEGPAFCHVTRYGEQRVVIDFIRLMKLRIGTFTRFMTVLMNAAKKGGIPVIEVAKVGTPELRAWCLKNHFHCVYGRDYDEWNMGGGYIKELN